MLYSDKARSALQANLSARYRRLDKLEAYVRGTQYDGRPSFHNAEVPMYDRAPCIVYPIVRAAIQSNVDLCIGEGRWPAITSGSSEDDSDFDEAGLSESDSETLDRFVCGIIEQSRLKAKARELLRSGQMCGTSVAICSVRKGRLVVDTTLAKWCKPKFDEFEPNIVTALEITYPYLEEYKDNAECKPALRCMLYRRIIDAVRDTTFLPINADEEGHEPHPSDWKVSKSFEHGFGFCPVVWYKHAAECSTVENVDGVAIHQDLLDEIDALNFGLSQRHVAAMIAASPPVVETGVEADHNPSAMGSDPHSAYVQGDDDSMRRWRSVHTGGPKAARKRGPNVVWRYPNENSKVSHLVIPGNALDPSDNDCRDLRSKIAEGLAVVFVDPENMRNAADISGRALREHHKRQVERCDTIRDEFGDGMLLPVVGMMLRICHVLAASGKASRLRVPGLAKVLPILDKSLIVVANDDGTEGVEWEPPTLRLTWPGYFAPSHAETKDVVESTLAAKSGGLITLATAVEHVKDIFGIGNVDQYVDTLEGEESEDAEDDAEEADAETPGPRDTMPAPPMGEDDEAA